MNSAVYFGSVMHDRVGSPGRRFGYPYYFFALDLEELPSQRSGVLFGYNRFRLFTIRDRDYLMPEERPILAKARAVLARAGIEGTTLKITLVTMPRFLGYVFNPVTFYLCQDCTGAVAALLVEVSNTFGERHLYTLRPPQASAAPLEFNFPKAFFVSPFYDVSGNYKLTVHEVGERLKITVDLYKDTGRIFSAAFAGQAEPLSNRVIAAALLRFPLTAPLTMLRIYRQALALFRTNGVRIFTKPAPTHPDVLRAESKTIYRVRLAILRFLQKDPDATKGGI